MFNINRSQNSKNSNGKDIKSEWLKFSSNPNNDEMIRTLSQDNRFIQEDIKLRKTVIAAFEKEFGKDIKNIKNFDFLVDTAVNKLKQKAAPSSDSEL